MASVEILAIGKIAKNSQEHVIISEYIKRTPWNFSIKELNLKKSLKPQDQVHEEAKLLLTNLSSKSYVIALDKSGKLLSSEAFSASMSKHANITFIIGGAYGFSNEVAKRADLLLSFGKVTWPHKFVRMMLAEQIYRAHSISNNHPYHK
jgi:23S rRNA (pseudouridine1915-N3)-methyltransferase